MRLVASPSLVPVLQIRQVTWLAQGGTVHSRSVAWTQPSVFRVLTLNITLKITLGLAEGALGLARDVGGAQGWSVLP